jgi:mitochondrial fission protein ELM1
MQVEKDIRPSLEYAWILTNGTAGMEAQGRAVAQAAGIPFKLKKVSVKWPLNWLPARLQIWIPPETFLRSVAGRESLCPPWPRLIVSVGRQTVATALAIKRLAGPLVFAVHIQKPTVAAHHFDWIAAPKHDGIQGPNVTTTLGAVHGITPIQMEAAKQRFAGLIEHLPRPRIAVLLGGNSRAYRFTSAQAERLGRSLATTAREHSGSLLITPSGRTPTEIVHVLKRTIGDVPHLIWDGTGENPYLAFLGFADAIVVTGDSVNMVTEAAGTGKPVYVEFLQGASRRIARFHAAMLEAGATRPFDGRLETWSYNPINDTELVARVIRQKLGLQKRATG